MDDVDVIHRLLHDNSMQRCRYALCGAVEEQRLGDRLNFTIQQSDVTCDDCLAVVDTGSVCPARRRWWHRKPREHVGEWTSMDIGHVRAGRCRHCGRHVEQRLLRSGRPTGPWIDTVAVPCTHGTGGRPTPCCMRCANDRADRGLAR